MAKKIETDDDLLEMIFEFADWLYEEYEITAFISADSDQVYFLNDLYAVLKEYTDIDKG